MSWNWKLLNDGTLQIYNDKALYWEVVNCKAKNQKEIDNFAMEAIKDLSDLLADI